MTVTGRAVGATEVAKEEAKVDALREAVRRVCATFINAQTEVEDFYGWAFGYRLSANGRSRNLAFLADGR